MRKMNRQQLIRECEYFNVTPPTNEKFSEAIENNSHIPISIVGCYYPKTEELHPWSGCSDYR